jgi:hypothetical protein
MNMNIITPQASVQFQVSNLHIKKMMGELSRIEVILGTTKTRKKERRRTSLNWKIRSKFIRIQLSFVRKVAKLDL